MVVRRARKSISGSACYGQGMSRGVRLLRAVRRGNPALALRDKDWAFDPDRMKNTPSAHTTGETRFGRSKEYMRGKLSPIKSLGERYLLIDADIHRAPESAGVIVLYGAQDVPIYVKSVSNMRIGLLDAKRRYHTAIEFALAGMEDADEKSRAQLEKVLKTAFGLRETRDREIVTSKGSPI